MDLQRWRMMLPEGPAHATMPAEWAVAARSVPELTKTRILFVCNSLVGGGAERIFTSLIAASAQRRCAYEMDIALLDEDPEAYDLPSWARVFRLDCRHGFFSSVARLTRLASSLRPHLTVSFLARSNVSSAVAMVLRRRPFIISERTNTAAQLARSKSPLLSKLLVRLTYHRAAQVIAVSQGVADALATRFGVPRGRITVINNPVDAQTVCSLATEEPACPVGPEDVVVMGRLRPEKNFALAIRAFARSDCRGRLIILGDGPLAAELKKLGVELGIGDRLLLPGFLRNPYAVISRASAFLVTSDHEGFCNSLLEAMALGVPVVATDCPFSPAEILSVTGSPAPGRFARGTGGLLIRKGDEHALASAIDVLASGAERTRLGLEGQQRVQAFDSARTMERYWEVIERVLREHAAGSSAIRECRAPAADVRVHH